MDARERRPRVVVMPFGLPRYRVAVFRILAAAADFDLEVVYGQAPGLANVDAAGFAARPARLWRLRTPFGYVGWDASQWHFARRGRTDVLVLTWNTRYVSLVPSLLRARRGGVKTLLWGHGYSRRESRWRRRLRLLVASLADGVVFYSHRDAERFAAEKGSRAGVFVAQNALDQAPIRVAAEQWSSDPGGMGAFRESKGLGRGPLLLFVSRYKPANRLELLLEAAAVLKQRHADLWVVLIGEGLDRPELRSRASDLGITDSIIAVGPVYEEFDLAPWFLTADVFCYPSNLGLSGLHAMGYGLPVVMGDDASRHPPEWQAVVDAGAGRTFREGDAADMAVVVDQLLADEALRMKMGTAGRRAVAERYSIEEMASGLRAAIEWCVGGAT